MNHFYTFLCPFEIEVIIPIRKLKKDVNEFIIDYLYPANLEHPPSKYIL